MTIRRQWLVVLTITAVLAVFINSIIFGSLINKYFLSYNAETYNYHVEQIRQLAASALRDNSLTQRQLSVQLESHLDDPIVSIKLYYADGRLAASAEHADNQNYGMMNGRMSGMLHSSSEEVDSYDITDGSLVIGVLHITRYSSLSNSMVSTMFKASLIRNSLISFLIVFAVLVSIGIFISRKLSRDLSNTTLLALSIDMGDRPEFKPSKVKEIRIIQSSLDTLQNRLKIKQIGRKQAVDEFVHQIRTPLTILRTHLEGLEDGVITMTGDEISICQSQIDSISSIIANMSMMLDANRPPEPAHTERFELHGLLSQIVSGMKVQFDQKKIDLNLRGSRNMMVTADKYKLSQSVYNLLTNAYKFTEPNGTVNLSYEASDTAISIRIQDTGIGISAEDLPHLFDAYYRGGNAGKLPGDGLGLYVVKENLEEMGGTISVSSRPGNGSEFVIVLPIL